MYRRNVLNNTPYDYYAYAFDNEHRYLQLNYSGKIPPQINYWLASLAFAPAIETVGRVIHEWAGDNTQQLTDLWVTYPGLMKHTTMCTLAETGQFMLEAGDQIADTSENLIYIVTMKSIRYSLAGFVRLLIESLHYNEPLPPDAGQQEVEFLNVANALSRISTDPLLKDLASHFITLQELIFFVIERSYAGELEVLAEGTRRSLLLLMQYDVLLQDHRPLMAIHTEIIAWLWENLPVD